MNIWCVEEADNNMRNHVLLKVKFSDRLTETEHEYCEFCMARFGNVNKDFKEGYRTQNYYYWVCEDCFDEYKEEYHWTVKS